MKANSLKKTILPSGKERQMTNQEYMVLDLQEVTTLPLNYLSYQLE